MPSEDESTTSRLDLYRAILDAIPHMIFVKDRAGRFVFANKPFQEFFGAESEDQVLGQTDIQFDQTAEDTLHFQHNDGQVIQTKKELAIPIEFAKSHTSERTALTTLKKPCLGSYVLGISSKLLHSSGVGGLISSIIDHAPDGIYVKDTKLRYVLVNASYLKMMRVAKPEDIIGRRYDEMGWPPNMQDVDEDNLVISTLTEKVSSAVDPQLRITKIPLCDSQSTAVGIMGFVRDVNQMQRLEQKLAWRDFNTKLAHHLKTRLFSLDTHFEVLKGEVGVNAIGQLGETIRRIDSALADVKSFMEDVGSRVRLGLPSRLERIQPKGIAERVAQAVGSPAISVEVSVSSVSWITCDKVSLYEMLLELCTNSIKSIRSRKDKGEAGYSGRIQITIEDRTNYISFVVNRRVVISIRDNGLGISPERRVKLFNREFSLTTGGWGIGLADVHDTVELCGGVIKELPQNDHGAVFELSFPVADG